MTEDEWKQYAAQNLKSELVRLGVGYEDLIQKLRGIGVDESYKGIASKINRGTFSFLFYAQCMKALGIRDVRLN